MNPSSPQAREMGDESMVRNLAAQAEAIWPQERPLFARYLLPASPRILDLGCGTGEITFRVAELFPASQIVGIDLDEGHLERARQRCSRFGDRVRFQKGDAWRSSCRQEHSTWSFAATCFRRCRTLAARWRRCAASPAQEDGSI